jgi:AcrR family transcriptional regulator
VTRHKTPSKKKAPRKRLESAAGLGRDATVAAVEGAARRLFAERGYAGVSVRDIAAAAGVNHGLIHRHFGAKEGVLQAVLQGMFTDIGTLALGKSVPGDPDFLAQLYPLVVQRKADWQILMRAVLDGFDFQAAGFRFPLTNAVLSHVAARRGTLDREARIRAGAIIAGGLGWLLLEEYLTPVLGLEGASPKALQARMAGLLSLLADAEA